MLNLLNAERIKLTSTRSPWWCTAVIVLAGIGLPALAMFAVTYARNHPSPQQTTVIPDATASFATVGFSGLFGISTFVFLTMATLVVTSEYRFGVIRTTFQAVPNRSAVLAVKALLVGVFGAVVGLITVFVAFYVSKAVAGPDYGKTMVLSGAEAWRSMLGIPVYLLLCAVLAIAVGALLRQSAAAIALLVLWPLVLEPMVALFGTYGHKVAALLPFRNAEHFYANDDSTPTWHWGPWGGLAYFAAFVAVVFIAALVTVNRRDA